MTLKTIYVVRHGVWTNHLEVEWKLDEIKTCLDDYYRMNWTVDSRTGIYSTSHSSPTGIASDPALAAYGVDQAKQLAEKVVTLKPKPTHFYSSPFYRCLQTLQPVYDRCAEGDGSQQPIRIEYGLGEFFGEARFVHPQPADLDTLRGHFPDISDSQATHIRPYHLGESIDMLHDRFAYALHHVIQDMDAEGAEAIIISTHAAGMIAIGRSLTGNMPEDFNTEDFRCGTCALSRYDRRPTAQTGSPDFGVALWNPTEPKQIPSTDWKGGRGIGGGWDCTMNGDCSFLKGGEERTWHFTGDESFLELDYEGTRISRDGSEVDENDSDEDGPDRAESNRNGNVGSKI